MPGSDHSPVFAPFFTIRDHFAAGPNSAINTGSLFYPASTFSVIGSMQESSQVNGVDFLEGTLSYIELNPLAMPTYQAFAWDAEIATKSGNVQNFGLVNAAFSQASHNGTGTVSNLIGLFGLCFNNASGNVTSMEGLSIERGNFGTGAITNMAGIVIASPFNSGGGTVTNSYGLLIPDQGTIATNNYNIFSSGTSSLNIFQGKIGMGTSTPNSFLDIRHDLAFEINQTAHSGVGSAWIFRGIGGSHTGLAASTENNDVYLNLNRPVQFSAGVKTINRAFLIDPNVTYSFTAASSLTDAVGFAVRGLPLQGTNAAIARSSTVMLGDYGVTANSARNTLLYALQLGLADGVGAATEISGLNVSNPLTVSLGNQTATLTDLAGAYFGAVSYSSTTNVRTVTRGSTVYIQGAPASAGNVTFTNTGGPFSLFVDAGTSRFDGAVMGASASITAANDLLLGDANLQSVSGNTQINGLSTTLASGPAITAGTKMTLLFSGTPTVKHNTAPSAGFAKIFLSGSVDFLAANNTLLGVVYDGTQWQETFRKAA